MVFYYRKGVEEVKKFILFNSFNNNEVIELATEINNRCESEKWNDILSKLLDFSLKYSLNGDLYKSYLCYLLSSDENLFTLSAEKMGRNIDKQLYSIALKDIEKIINLFSLELDFCTIGNNNIYYLEEISNIFKDNNSPKEILDLLLDFFYKNGAGVMNKYKGFRWSKDEGLIGIDNCDPITFKELIGYERQKEILIKNTESFIRGNLSNNILLFGDSGTGKSSSIKALLNEYYQKGLRIIELNKSDFMDLNKILACIKDRGLKYILFLDDLSFEEFECEYKHMKALIEGGLQVRPENVLIYATSNRRNLIRENFNDREGGEIHARESIEEKHSLAERFGITLTYSTGNQKEYLDTVYKLAEIYKVELSKERLKEEAIKWSALSSGRSSRIAKQFIMSLKGEVLL